MFEAKLYYEKLKSSNSLSVNEDAYVLEKTDLKFKELEKNLTL